MKIALLGNGKTGHFIKNSDFEVSVFNSTNILTKVKIEDCDIVISFVPGSVFVEYIDELFESKKPVIVASTGFQWPNNFDKKLKEENLTWVYSSNFSKGLFIYKALIELLEKKYKLLNSPTCHIHEVHHTKKLDSPSGTALSINAWFGNNAKITSERTGDIVGFHELTISTDSEEIKISHNAKTRKVFADGAIKACELVLQNKLKPGLNQFYEVL